MSNIFYIWKTPDIHRSYNSAISLHGHTLHSKESLEFLMVHAERNALLRWAMQTQIKRCIRPKADFSRAYWIAPISARTAYEIERDQIENRLGLSSIVSITDHDNIEAPLQLRLLPRTRNIPISLEWTVPFEDIKVHLGIHNLPSSSAQRWLSEMHEYTRGMQQLRLEELLAGLHEIKDLLIVLNHPMWDLCAIGQQAHICTLHNFLHKHNRFLHAFELGGMRSWQENQKVVDLAAGWNQAIISGGDRHGFEASAVLNLTHAKTFGEFVHEIRNERRSELVFMPQYQRSIIWRILHTVNDVTQFVPNNPYGQHWQDRVFHPDASGSISPVSHIWKTSPRSIRAFLAILRMLEAKPVDGFIQTLTGRSNNSFRTPPLGEDGGAA